MTQEPPFAIQIEPVEGCSLACSFCGIQSIRANGAFAAIGVHGKNSAPYRFMEPSTLASVVRDVADLGWNPRWEFAMHGEPTMHPDLPGLVALVRRRLPKASIMVTTNGSGVLRPDKISDLFEAGLNTLAFDAYDHAPWKQRMLDIIEPLKGGNWIDVLYYPANKKASPHTRFNGKRIVIIDDISRNVDGTHTLTNQGGNSFVAMKNPLAQRCAKPFRELSVRWDGNVALCCDDWKGEYKIGNVTASPLDKLWNHPRFEAARRRLYHSDRAFGPCEGCDVTTYRNGLLPDKMGKQTMPRADESSERHLKEALRGRVFTLKVAP